MQCKTLAAFDCNQDLHVPLNLLSSFEFLINFYTPFSAPFPHLVGVRIHERRIFPNSFAYFSNNSLVC